MNKKDDQPLVSIITPCYNVSEYIKEFLDSVLAQTYNNIELILIEDGSSDRTREIIETYRQKIIERGYEFVFLHQENSGQASALNKGLSIFKGTYLTWPDADDLLSQNNIEVKVSFLRKNPEYGLVRGKRVFFRDSASKLYCLSNDDIYFNNENIFYDLFMERTFCNGGCYMMRRKLFEECYPEHSIFPSREGQNWQLLVPAASRSKCGNIDCDLFFIREHYESHSRKSRTIEEWFSRFDGLKAILYNAFDHSVCDTNKCKAMVEQKYLREKYKIAIEYRRTTLAREYFIKLIKNKTVTKSDIVAFLKYSIPIFNKNKNRTA